MENIANTCRIAVVEDGLVERRLYEQNLSSRFGYKVDSFESGEELLVCIENGNVYDSILIDQILLPDGMTGLMTYERLKSYNVSTPVVMISSFVSAELIYAFTKAGGAGYVPKPITDWEYLDWEIKRVVESHERQKKFEMLARRTQELEMQKKTTDAFFDLVAHELRKPISIILGSVQCASMIDDITVNAEAKKLLDNIEQYSLRLNVFLNSLLSVCGVDRCQIAEVAPVDLSVLLQSAVTDLKRNILKERDVDLDYVNFGSCLVRVNPDQLFQVLLNLVDNAVKYSRVKPEIKIISQDSQNIDYIEILVVDNGIGIGEKDVPNIFDQFRRVEELADVKGSGLGLFVSKRIIEMLGGEIWVLSKEGQGSTFVLRLKRELSN